MSLQMYMKIDGVEGDTRSPKYKGWSDILSFTWGMTSNRKQAAVATGDQTSLNEITIVKPLAIDSPAIRELFASGTIIPGVQISVLPAAVKRQLARRYVDITMQGVLIKSVVTRGAAEETFFQEHVCLLFDRVSFELSQYARADESQDDTDAVTTAFGWNVSANSAWPGEGG